MKEKNSIPFHLSAKVTCVCGNVFYVGSTKKELNIEACFKCHPAFTGEDKILQTVTQVQKFKEKLEKIGRKKREKEK